MAKYDCSDLCDDLYDKLVLSGVPLGVGFTPDTLAAVLRECVIVHKDDPRAERLMTTKLPPQSDCVHDGLGMVGWAFLLVVGGCLFVAGFALGWYWNVPTP